MLESLFIKDFILIQQLNVDFNNDFSAFTGETGAGKSIFIDAISALLGERVSTSVVKAPASKAIIEGVFTLTDDIKAKLEQAGYDSSAFIVTKEITTDGKSTIRLNQRVTTTSFIKDCLNNYIDIHNQHDNQYLLNEKYHLSLLDSYCKLTDQVSILKNKYSNYTKAVNEYNELLSSQFNPDQIDLFNYQINEIDSLKLKVGEDEELEKQIKQYSQIEKYKTLKDNLEDIISNQVLTSLYQANKQLSSLNDISELQESINNLNDSYYTIQDCYDIISNFLDNLTNDSSNIDQLNERLFEIQRLKRKYSTDIDGLLQLSIRNKELVENYQNKDAVLNKIKQKIDINYNDYYQYAQLISSIRKEKSKDLSIQIKQQLKDLNLENALFEVDFKESNPTNLGIDEVTFMVSMNPGMPVLPLSKVASGGELSRLMLGLKTIFAKLNGTKLIIFDEIDTGVSGKVAFSIGQKMHEISKDMQVFSITHLPAVAANADSHYKITKTQSDDNTITSLTKLDAEQRVNELALLSSSTITNSSLSAARELFERGQNH